MRIANRLQAALQLVANDVGARTCEVGAKVRKPGLNEIKEEYHAVKESKLVHLSGGKSVFVFFECFKDRK